MIVTEQPMTTHSEGSGLIMKAEPIIKNSCKSFSDDKQAPRCSSVPQGKLFDNKKALD